jgi:ribosomal protein L21E
MNRLTRRLKGKSIVTVAEYVKTFKVGDKVVIIPKAKFIGMPHLRYSNRHGLIIEKRGKSYVVEVKDYSTTKKIVVSPIHLRLSL